MRIVFLNGPPRSGKDTAAHAILATFHGSALFRFAGPLKRATHELFGLPHSTGHYEDRKGVSCPEFHGATPREAYIAVSESMVKPVLGVDFFGRVLADRLARVDGLSLAVVPDSGFAAEAAPVLERFGRENVMLIRVHADGRRCSFDGDSRGYISLPGVHTVALPNDGHPRDFQNRAVKAVSWWLEGPEQCCPY